MSDRILIFGHGQMANFYDKYFKLKGYESFIAASVDITKSLDLTKSIEEFKPTIVINAAAKTNLEWCGLNKLETFNVNVLGTDNIAKLCDENNIYFIHLSSGCIYDSKDEDDLRKETDLPNPYAYYSWTKVWAEELIKFNRSRDFKFLILRPRQPVSSEVSYKNMLMKMLTFTMFIDTPNSGTVIEDLMGWTDELMKQRLTGIYNVANEGFTTPYEIGLMLKKYVLPSLDVKKVSKEELDKITPNRRIDTILDVSKLKRTGVVVEDYSKRLEEIIKEFAVKIENCDKKVLEVELNKTLEQTKTRAVPNEVWKDLLK